jgi:hypothetical protein
MGEQQRADILAVGIITDEGEPKGWTFDCRGEVPMAAFDPTRGVLFGGYSLDELREMSRRSDKPGEESNEWLN